MNLLASVLLNSEASDMIDKYSDMFESQYVQPIIFCEFTIILILAVCARFIMLYKYESLKQKKKKVSREDTRYMRIYIWGHCLIELLIAFIICYVIVKLTHANPESYIINMIIGPAVGLVSAIYIDNKFIIPLEAASGLGTLMAEKVKKKSKDEDANKDGNGVNIVINNGNVENEQKTPAMKILQSSSISQYLDKSLADTEEFDETVIDAINKIKAEQDNQGAKIDENTIRLESTIESLNILKKSEMVNKKIELKRMIYECLNQGYATPEQNDKITLYYHSYIALGGNHEVESLYEQHYLKLDVHDDRRINGQKSHSVTIERRDPDRRVYVYGEFDDETEE